MHQDLCLTYFILGPKHKTTEAVDSMGTISRNFITASLFRYGDDGMLVQTVCNLVWKADKAGCKDRTR